MQAQFDSVLATAIGILAGIISFVFDLPAPAVFAAFVGSCFGIALSEAMEYSKALKYLIGATIASGLTASMFIHYFGDYPQRGVAALLAFCFIRYRSTILKRLDKAIGGA